MGALGNHRGPEGIVDTQQLSRLAINGQDPAFRVVDFAEHQQALGRGLDLVALPIRREARLRARESDAAKPPLLAALTDGEDYELCFTLGQGNAVALLDQFGKAFPETPISCIGKVVAEPGLKIQQKDGTKEFATRGFVHFQ